MLKLARKSKKKNKKNANQPSFFLVFACFFMRWRDYFSLFVARFREYFIPLHPKIMNY